MLESLSQRTAVRKLELTGRDDTSGPGRRPDFSRVPCGLWHRPRQSYMMIIYDDHRSYSVSQREAIFRTAFRSPESSEKNWEVPFQCPATARNPAHQDLVKIWEDKIMPKSLCGWTQNGARITIWEGFKHRIGMLSLHGNHWKSCPEAGLPRGPI